MTSNVKVNPKPQLKPQPPSGDPNLKPQTPAQTSSDSGEILIPGEQAHQAKLGFHVITKLASMTIKFSKIAEK